MNRFDDFRPHLDKLLAEQESRLPPPDPAARSADGLRPLWRLGALARLYGGGALARAGLHRRLVHANVTLAWFDEFRDYWVNELGNRSIEPHEFHFLHGVYRQRIYRPRDPRDEFAGRQGWQDPRAIYQVFHHQYRLALNPFPARRYVRYVPRNAEICEYGCGIAPMTTSLIRYYRHLNFRVTCADLPSLMFHFVRWKFRSRPFVRTLALELDAPPALNERFDVVFCLQVFKYVPNPLVVVQQMEDALRPGGHLIFDYFRPGEGTDRIGPRLETLRYLAERFDVVAGAIPLDGSHVHEVVARKRAER